MTQIIQCQPAKTLNTLTYHLLLADKKEYLWVDTDNYNWRRKGSQTVTDIRTFDEMNGNIRSYLSAWSYYIFVDVIISLHTKKPEFAHACIPVFY